MAKSDDLVSLKTLARCSWPESKRRSQSWSRVEKDKRPLGQRPLALDGPDVWGWLTRLGPRSGCGARPRFVGLGLEPWTWTLGNRPMPKRKSARCQDSASVHRPLGHRFCNDADICSQVTDRSSFFFSFFFSFLSRAAEPVGSKFRPDMMRHLSFDDALDPVLPISPKQAIPHIPINNATDPFVQGSSPSSNRASPRSARPVLGR